MTVDAAAASTQLTRALFGTQYDQPHFLASETPSTHRIAIAHKLNTEYKDLSDLPPQIAAKQNRPAKRAKVNDDRDGSNANTMKLIEDIRPQSHSEKLSKELTIRQAQNSGTDAASGDGGGVNNNTVSLARRAAMQQVRPEWHAPWKLMRVISGHLGWVRAMAIEPNNKWFCTGSGDRTIKIWDLASGTLKLSLTGHISTVRGLAVSARHPYLFSCGEDKQVKCWDLESNKVIRHYHGHLSGVYALALHPTIDVLVTAGRDAVARVWDMRTRQNVHVLAGHKSTIADVGCQDSDPQVITGSMDSTVRLWDLAAGKCATTLTHHKRSVRALALHPKEFSFASASVDNIKAWGCPEGSLLGTFDPPSAITNTLGVNADNVLFSGADNGTMAFYDWKSGHRFQSLESQVQPGSLASEAGIFCSRFDRTGLRLLTGEADKTIKVWRQDEHANEQNTPLEWEPSLRRRKY
ncbi:putative MRNA splicing protein [Taphrina deformans PYCC 5710]|uniref:Pre-mRNA-splicing factor PRP46 n=1 Tax=Taphrina deformans (strain PYCC 5710 / ATCC 11124 / CBS 356.35 / IMI 108563 / JCM 9778 / NBRC 8474) TaxID=1097556 RepID=R4XFU7_TAPDE|nr:putative MRNA splicing protein [Taphrina deformans PYCC 5710]|eukprot:CCG82244.1 putative MRNA splicing protein [Taphrina deformans PYCC 5710]